MKPSDYYFCTFMDDGEQLYCLTSIEYWNENECLDDCLADIECLPSKFHNSAEAVWEYNGTPEAFFIKLSPINPNPCSDENAMGNGVVDGNNLL